jgi:hypothetical protein
MIAAAVTTFYSAARAALAAVRAVSKPSAYGTPKSAPSLGAAGAVRAAAGPRPRLFRLTPSADRRV